MARAEIKKRWFCRGVPRGSEKVHEHEHTTLPEALDEALAMIGKSAKTVIVFHDTDADVRLRWSKKDGYEFATPFVRDYIKGLTGG